MLSSQLLLRYCKLRVISAQVQVTTRQNSGYKSKFPSRSDTNKNRDTNTNTKTHGANRIYTENRQFRNNFSKNNAEHITNTAQFRRNIDENKGRPDIHYTNRRMENPSRIHPTERHQMSHSNNFQLQRNDPGAHSSKQFRGSWEDNNRWSNQRVARRMPNMPHKDSISHQVLNKKIFNAAQEIDKAVKWNNSNSVTADLMRKVQDSHRPATNKSAFATEKQPNVNKDQGEEIESNSWSYKFTAAKGLVKQTRTPFTNYRGNTFAGVKNILRIPEVVNKCEDSQFEMATWNSELQKYFRYLLRHAPQNGFEEMIELTEKGLLWKFPIDNEQGMESENNVHFTEHVFLDRHLKGWCPTHGPIRHFMDLVCIGLSNNPYITVNEKIDHIMWYRDYFADKSKLLLEVGAITEEIPKKQAQLQSEA